MSRKTIYHLENVRHFYGTKKALDIDTLDIPQGSITGMMGPNGSGKSTLLKLLAFAERPTQGQIYFNGKPEVPFSASVRFKISLLTQKPYLLKRTVYENAAYGLKIRGENGDVPLKIARALDQVGLAFDEFSSRKWHQLSGGEAQRVALAARLVLRPEVLLLDEPTASVDAQSAKRIRDASIKARDDLGTTLIVASHDWQWLYEISDTLLYLHNGRLFKTGTENIIPGPWIPEGNGLCSRNLKNGQRIILNAPPRPDAFALINKNDISIEKDITGTNRPENSIRGTVKSLIQGKTSEKDTIIMLIQADDLNLTLQFDRHKAQDIGIYPGQEILMRIQPDSVTWI